MIHQTSGAGNIELQSSLGAALTAIDQRLLDDGTKETLEVNRPKRVVPHYPFVPSHHHPDPWGAPDYNVAQVHKKVGKKTGSKRG